MSGGLTMIVSLQWISTISMITSTRMMLLKMYLILFTPVMKLILSLLLVQHLYQLKTEDLGEDITETYQNDVICHLISSKSSQ